MWPQPSEEPPVDVDRAVLITIHHQTAVRTAIRADPQWHVFFSLADMAGLRRIALIYYIEFFPNVQTLVSKHLIALEAADDCMGRRMCIASC